VIFRRVFCCIMTDIILAAKGNRLSTLDIKQRMMECSNPWNKYDEAYWVLMDIQLHLSKRKDLIPIRSGKEGQGKGIWIPNLTCAWLEKQGCTRTIPYIGQQPYHAWYENTYISTSQSKTTGKQQLDHSQSLVIQQHKRLKQHVGPLDKPSPKESTEECIHRENLSSLRQISKSPKPNKSNEKTMLNSNGENLQWPTRSLINCF